MTNSIPRTDTREALISASRRLVLSRSYGSVGVAEICAAAGVKKGSLYHFFASKEALVLEMLDALYREIEQEVLDPSLEGPESFSARLRLFVERLHAFETRAQDEVGELPGCPFGNLALELATWNSAVRDAVAAHLEALRGRFRRTIVTATEQGELAMHADAERLSEQWLALVEGMLVLAKARQDPDTILQLIPALEALLPVQSGNDDDDRRDIG